MISILGPAKTIDMSPHNVTSEYSLPQYLVKTAELADHLKGKSFEALKKLWNVSPKLAEENRDRILSWHPDYNEKEANQSILSFSGEVFNGLQARNLTEKDLLFAQENVRILSGFYGVLKPLDLILPYRLEMGTRMSFKKWKNLYDYWKSIIPAEITTLTANSESKVLINLASQEYFKSIAPAKFPYRIITPVFKEQAGSGFRNVTIYAKKARGLMLRFIIQNRINDPDLLRAFDAEGYYFNEDLSTENEWCFCR